MDHLYIDVKTHLPHKWAISLYLKTMVTPVKQKASLNHKISSPVIIIKSVQESLLFVRLQQ